MNTSPDAVVRQPPRVHEHGWSTVSTHRTSGGTVVYVRCACGALRIDLTRNDGLPPVALSRTVPR